MIHILLIDSFDKLSLKKDSSILLAQAFQEMGVEAYFLFEEDFYFSNGVDSPIFKVFPFDIKKEENSFYLEKVELKKEKLLSIGGSTTLHMRLDPPFDSRYMRYQWMLKGLCSLYGLKVVNDPKGVLIHNEKMVAYQRVSAVSTYVGSNTKEFIRFAREQQNKGSEGLILKPLDLYQGIGVEKVDFRDNIKESNEGGDYLEECFNRKIQEYKGPVVVQPYLKEVESGEVRSIFFQGRHLGSILKVPPKGEFLANIAQGAKFGRYELSEKVQEECLKICREMMIDNVPWVAFDILGEKIQEVNITCPGLLVEVSQAMGRNLALDIVDILES